jgi:NAD(P)-dependent dehydrogenase (short-subunit alcohol dehydrogenase family)
MESSLPMLDEPILGVKAPQARGPDSRKVALVTGAGSGIGKAVSSALAADGYVVVLAGRRPEPLALVASEIATHGQRALPVIADVSNAESVRALFQRIRAELGRLDLLFNNAGTNARTAPIEALTLQEWQQELTLTVMATQMPFVGRG